ncbi:diphosphomevalonate decarboxylase [Suttonella sp. R2A3]|uniref:diphosphomevalonate decarboxylase n=1 Tax=Suttonella sp. R2A3 TaxID=2908648 RepID=UPI001F38A939|nr:diphosphomevalonate decarboxylase [Suttonella sp. R2A3]UJF23640.1 diphosphomevalonate decarboxylase [Suttonella sp. R2A3]
MNERKAQFFNAHLPNTLQPNSCGEAFAPSNIALAKYWGKRDYELNLPTNGSLSISLGTLGTRTTLKPADKDSVSLNGKSLSLDTPFAQKVIAFIDLFRRSQPLPLTIETHNTIPTAAGLASSASGFAALTLAINDLFNLDLAQTTLSAMARIGSGSASRSLWHGFVQWDKGEQTDGSDSIAQPIASNWRDLRVGLLALSHAEKHTTSRDGMTHTAETSPLFSVWPAQAERDKAQIHQAIVNQDFHELGATAEANALAMHATMLAARPSLTYFLPETLATIAAVQKARADGLPVYLTIDAGPNVKLLYLAKDEADIRHTFAGVACVNPFQ